MISPKEGNILKNYEIAVVLHPDLEIDLDRATGKIEKVIESNKGKIVKKDNWGKRKLAYKIKKQDWGIYVFYQAQLDPANIAKIDSSFRITSEIMRYLIISLENVDRIKKSKSTVNPAKTKTKDDDKVSASGEEVSNG